MKLYLHPVSSLELMRYLRSTNEEFRLIGTPMRKRAIPDAINTTREMNELDETAQRWLGHAGNPVHVFVHERDKSTATKRMVTHVRNGDMPYGAMVDLGHGICMCSPHFMFMQLGAKLDLIEEILVGMELCGTYSKWRLAPMRMGDPYYRSPADEKACTFKLSAAMHLKQARGFIERNSALRGSVGARAALKWVLEGSASPMETAVYLLLCLPKRLGGYGLPKPILNPKVIVSNPSGTKERYPDLFWTGSNIDVEYNSDSEHSGEWTRYRDSQREIELTVGNIKVLPLTRPQLMSADGFDEFAQGLRRMLHIRTRPIDVDWLFKRDELRRRLLMSWR